MLDDPHDHRHENGCQDTCHNGKMEFRVFVFNVDIAGQSSDPAQLVPEKIDDDADEEDDKPNENNDLSCAL